MTHRARGPLKSVDRTPPSLTHLSVRIPPRKSPQCLRREHAPEAFEKVQTPGLRVAAPTHHHGGHFRKAPPRERVT